MSHAQRYLWIHINLIFFFFFREESQEVKDFKFTE